MNTVRHVLQLKGNLVWTISPDASVFEALRVMAEKERRRAVVVHNGQIVGIISERDYARKIILLGKTSRDTPVSEIMTREVVTIHPDDTLDECMEAMSRHRVRHLPVIEGDEMVGIISIGDVVRTIIHDQREKIKELEERMNIQP